MKSWHLTYISRASHFSASLTKIFRLKKWSGHGWSGQSAGATPELCGLHMNGSGVRSGHSPRFDSSYSPYQLYRGIGLVSVHEQVSRAFDPDYV